MAKPDPRGESGILGPGGKRGPRGARGKTGAMGAAGATGPMGPAGPAGPVAPENHLNALAVIHDQVGHIHHELDVQMKRMAQLQMELDDARATLKRLMDKFN
jgi:hypothetical protein